MKIKKDENCEHSMSISGAIIIVLKRVSCISKNPQRFNARLQSKINFSLFSFLIQWVRKESNSYKVHQYCINMDGINFYIHFFGVRGVCKPPPPSTHSYLLSKWRIMALCKGVCLFECGYVDRWMENLWRQTISLSHTHLDDFICVWINILLEIGGFGTEGIWVMLTGKERNSPTLGVRKKQLLSVCIYLRHKKCF